MKRFLLFLVLIVTFVPLAQANAFFPNKNEINVGFFDKKLWNPDIPHHLSPIAFSASAKAESGQMLMYERTIYHTKKYFSIVAGVDISHWARQSSHLVTLSGFIGFKWWMFRTKIFNPYLFYSIAGPTLISSNHFGSAKLSSANFLFQDMIGVGAALGSTQRFDVRLSLVHYSNGDLFVENNGFDVPILISVGMRF